MRTLIQNCVFVLALTCAIAVPADALHTAGSRGRDGRWVGTWATSPQLEDKGNALAPPGFADATLRQVVHVSIGGKRIRVRFSNLFGGAPLIILSAHVAVSAGGGAIRAESDKALTFGGRPEATIAPGGLVVSDPLDFGLAPLSDLAVTIYLRGAPDDVTTHAGARATSYIAAGRSVSAADLAGALRVDHWYFLNGVDVLAADSAAAVAILGDSITDGRNSTTNGNTRWTDDLARRLQASGSDAEIGVLNEGIGGNRLLHDGLGPNALARLDRDVLAESGVCWLVVLEGINDIGTRVSNRDQNEQPASARDMIAAYDQIIERAHARGLRVYGATLLPYGGAFYFSADGEADRQAVNQWIRTSGKFDGVIDFDLAARDAANPSRLAAGFDSGDHLHPGADGYKAMADAVDLKLFQNVGKACPAH
jgi:lysophospholipase L1-like esterase